MFARRVALERAAGPLTSGLKSTTSVPVLRVSLFPSNRLLLALMQRLDNVIQSYGPISSLSTIPPLRFDLGH